MVQRFGTCEGLDDVLTAPVTSQAVGYSNTTFNVMSRRQCHEKLGKPCKDFEERAALGAAQLT